MARSSKKADRGAASVALFLVVAALVIVAVLKVRQDEFLLGVQLAVWACFAFDPRVCRWGDPPSPQADRLVLA